jgi:NADH-quinone oxidoreductase subunit C
LAEQRNGLARGGLTSEELAKKIAEKFPSGVTIASTGPHTINATADKDVLLQVCEFIKNELDFEHVSSVGGVDWLAENKMQTVYHITSYANRVTLEIVVDLPRDKPEVDSISNLWGGANWHERETFDMFGIIFKGHPRLERILNPEGTEVFPFRKDFVTGRRV